MPESFTVVPLSPLRKVIAARMTEALRTVPHFRVVADIEVDNLLTARAELNTTRPNLKISLNHCLIKACATVLMEHPALNVQFVSETIRSYQQADISVIVAITGGLSTPVVRSADRKSLQEIATEVESLVARAHAGQLTMDEILGGSFSVSNLGAYGIEQFDAIVNIPQCAILAIARAKQKIVIREGVPKIANVMRVTLSADHRAIDGSAAAAYLVALRRLIEGPSKLFDHV
jgi:pyruvate dehydrogenase E2 component (dihydrolipoamide acetyltransferase)